MFDYQGVKAAHQLMVALSVTGFSLRGLLMWRGSPLLMRRWMRTWPHFIDTALLLSGVWLAWTLRLNPLDHAWLATKLVLLLLYIALGFIALRLGHTRRIRLLALVGALVCFGYMVAVAMTKSALP
jgi:uncharacterized membrane protein SirB2